MNRRILLVIWLFGLHPLPVHLVVLITEMQTPFNKKVMNLSVSYKSDGVNVTTIDFNATTFEPIELLMIYLKIEIPDSQGDTEYRKVLIQTTFNVQKVWKGIFGSYAVKIFMSNINEALEGDLVFPLQPKKYIVRNLTFSDEFIPILGNIKIKSNIRVKGKLLGKKGLVLFADVIVYARVTRR